MSSIVSTAIQHPGKLSQQSLTEFFKSSIEEILEKRCIYADEATVFYLVNLMTGVYLTDAFYQRGRENLDTKPLAYVFRDAREGDSIQKYHKLKTIGDFALVMSGFFHEHLQRARRPDQREYFVDMGKNAYSALTDLVIHASSHPVYVFEQLSDRIMDFRGTLDELSVRTAPRDYKTIMKLHSRWLDGQQSWIQEVLTGWGIPVQSNPSIIQ